MKKPMKQFLGTMALVAALIGGYQLYSSQAQGGNSPWVTVVQSNHVVFHEVEDLENYADLIVVGQVKTDLKEDKKVVTENQFGRRDDFYTITPFHVNQYLKGETDTKVIDVVQPLVLTSFDKLLLQEGYSQLKKNSKYILFLKETQQEGLYSIVAVNQGKFNLDGTDTEEQKVHEAEGQVKVLKDKVLKTYKDKINP